MGKIQISKYVFYDTDCHRFYLTSEAQNIIYRVKNVICSYSGSNDWCNHFVCQMVDLYSGASIYNYALGTTDHEKEIPSLIKDGYADNVIRFIKRIPTEEWGMAMGKSIDFVIDNLVEV
jgi:hypothetical protein